jgi:hypothetical protein
MNKIFSLSIIGPCYLSVASRTVKLLIPHCASLCAADNPAIPAPTITTAGSGLQGSTMQSAIVQTSKSVGFAGFFAVVSHFSPLLLEHRRLNTHRIRLGQRNLKTGGGAPSEVIPSFSRRVRLHQQGRFCQHFV